MSDFRAQILATLDDKKIPSEIKNKIENREVKLNRISLNTKTLPSEIQASLDKHKFTISLDGIKTNNIDSQIGKSTKRSVSDITKAYNEAMRLQREIGSIQFRINGLDSNKNSEEISALVERFKKLQLEYNNVRASFDQDFSSDQLHNLNRAADDTIDKISILNAKLADKRTANTEATNSATIKELNKESEAFISLGKRIESIKIKIAELESSGGKTNQISVLRQQLDELEESYSKSMSTFMHKMTSSADIMPMGDFSKFSNEYDSVIQNTKNKLDELEAKAEDAKIALQNTIKGKVDDGSIQASISQVSSQYQKLSSTGHSSLSSIKNDIAQLNILHQSMKTQTGDELALSYEKFNQTLARVKNALTVVSSEGKKMASALQVQTLDNKMSTWLDKNSRASKDFGASIESLRNKLSTLHSTGELTEDALKGIDKEFNSIKQSAIAAGKTGKSFTSTFANAFRSISNYLTISTIIGTATRSLKQMYQNVYDIDTTMTELRKVTDETAGSYSKFLDNAASNSKKIGTTVSDLIKSTADFARLGNSFEDSQELAEVANVYAVVGDEIENVDTATKSVVSTMTAFNVEVSDAMSIVDKLNEVGNNFAISSGGIGNALERSASSLAASNNTLDQSIALITAANTVVQDPDAVGKQTMPTLKITISVKTQRWPRPRKDFADIVTRQLGRACFYFVDKRRNLYRERMHIFIVC